eukprot:maker-scaffold1442_size41114-snap-gene-0.20 protein:Tk02299 transcript:maker-scaffold1442_size41114-snap-gene-0.20-mRNA-1 annotation:"GH21451"
MSRRSEDLVEDEEPTSSEDEDLDYYYYSYNEDLEDPASGQLNNNEDPEFFQHECQTRPQIEAWLQGEVESLCQTAQIGPYLAQLALQQSQWDTQRALDSLHLFRPRPQAASSASSSSAPPYGLAHSGPRYCQVCATDHADGTLFSSLVCGHAFCPSCWEAYFQCQIEQGMTMSLSCMSNQCHMLATEDFIVRHVRKPNILAKYHDAVFHENVRSHAQLRFCPGLNCTMVFRCVKPQNKRCICSLCQAVCCFTCGSTYHAPTNCETIKRWLTKCADDSETANYISAHTKDCPKCNICIEKNGGCNHMQCYNCKHDFCWMCLGDWRNHGSEYYECSRYKENPNIAHESAHAQAREALKKYLHYFERWENHSKSIKLEVQTTEKIKNRINDKVMGGSGTWIDWQYLLDAAGLLAKCRYTLQYTYPYAYYMEPCPRKELFEYQQAQLEAEIENLSWKIEHAESTDRGDLENQIDIAEKRRSSLLKDFLAS